MLFFGCRACNIDYSLKKSVIVNILENGHSREQISAQIGHQQHIGNMLINLDY